MITRDKTKPVFVKDLQIGGQNRCVLQSMTNIPAKDVESAVRQINELAQAGCQLVRTAILDKEDAAAVAKIKESISIPLVGDIHFNYLLALKAIEGGIDAIRINPGNIGRRSHTEEVVSACKDRNIPIRIGINAGSLEKELLDKYGGPTPKAMLESADKHIAILENLGFYDIVLSFKSSDVTLTTDTYLQAAEKYAYPLHLGLTEAGGFTDSAIKSAAALAPLLHQNIGDTIRISVSGPPLKELIIAKKLLKCFGLWDDVSDIIACPTCGRMQYNMLPLVSQMEDYLSGINANITVAIMGCPVNGIQEASRADIGIAGGYNSGILFRKGEIIRTVAQEDMKEALIKEINDFLKERQR